MSDAQLSRLKTLFSDALEIPPVDRADFILDATSSDPLLRRELASLLDAHVSSESWFDTFQQNVLGPALASLEELTGDSLKVGQQVSHYQLIERIGGGGMGVVFKARDTRLGRLVALKFLPQQHASNPAARQRLIAEARAASRLDHLNIGTVYEIGEADDGLQFIAMAWYQGETLKSRIRRGPLTKDEVVAVGSGVASALAAAHEAGIVHRDVKPSNVILISSGTPKLVDFGIATFTSTEAEERPSLAGTLPYMSPEQTLGKPVDTRTDIWSLGVTLYESLTGERPFHGATEEDLISAIRNEEPGFPPTVDPSMQRVLRTCLAKERERRFQTAETLLDALSKSAALSSTQRSAARPRRSRAYAFMAFASLAVMVAVGLLYSGARETSRREALIASPIVISVIADKAESDSIRGAAEAVREDLREELGRIATVSVSSSASGSNYIARTTLNATNPLSVEARVVSATGADSLSRTFVSHENVDPVRELTREIVSAIDAPLSASEKKILATSRVRNSESYALYLLGLREEVEGRPSRGLDPQNADRLRAAQAFYARSRQLDPEFAPVRTHLAVTHIASALTFDTTSARLEQARLEAQTALRFEPVNAEARSALASYWSRSGKREKAIEELESALRVTPNSVILLVALGEQYRASGRLDDGIAMFNRALKLDPLNPSALWLFATTSGRTRHYGDSFAAHSIYLSLRPYDYELRLIRGQAYLRWKGVGDTLFSDTKRIPAGWDNRGMATYARYTALRVMRRDSEALAMLNSSRVSLSTDGLVYQPRALMRAEIYHDMGDKTHADAFYARAVRQLTDSSRANPRNPNILVSLALAYAGLGRNRDALTTLQRAIDAAPVSKETPVATSILGLAVEVYARTGELDRAFETIELLLTMPAGREMSIPLLKAWPGFDPLRNDPRYAAIIKRF